MSLGVTVGVVSTTGIAEPFFARGFEVLAFLFSAVLEVFFAMILKFWKIKRCGPKPDFYNAKIGRTEKAKRSKNFKIILRLARSKMMLASFFIKLLKEIRRPVLR